MAQVLGLVQVNWNGSNIPVEKGSKVKLGGLLQKPVITGSQVDYTTEYDASEVTVVTTLKKGDALYSIFTPGAGPLIVTCDTGQTYSWGDGFITNLPEFTAGDGGKVSIKWNASQAVELVQ
jgi:hypothetical protein